MRLSWGVNALGECFVVDSDKNPHEAISGPLTVFQAIVFIDRLHRKLKKANKNDANNTINKRVQNSKSNR